MKDQAIWALFHFPQLGSFALVTHQFAVCERFWEHLDHWERAHPSNQLVEVFGPQHGFYQTEQDNMIETEDEFFFWQGRHLPLKSLYGPRWKPEGNFQTLLFVLPDVGCRTYTYMSTLAHCLDWCAQHGVRLLLWDFPNPLGLVSWDEGIQCLGGPCLSQNWKSYITLFPIPLRHGLTLGELGWFWVKWKQLKVDYEVIPVPHLSRKESVKNLRERFERHNPFFFPSPNLPTWESAFFFPQMVWLEATTISEGRGTTHPFQLVGHPHWKEKAWQGEWPEGLRVLPCAFRPQFNKHAQEVCWGWHLSLKNDPLLVPHWDWWGLDFLTQLQRYFPNWSFRDHPYEYGEERALTLLLSSEHWVEWFDWGKKGQFQNQTKASFQALIQKDQKENEKFLQFLQDERIFIYHTKREYST